MKPIARSGLALLTFVSIAGCAAASMTGCASTRADKKVDQDLAQMPRPTSSADVQETIDAAIAKAPNLSVEQKARLTALRAASAKELQDIREQWLTMENLLVKKLLAAGYDAKETRALERRMRDLDSKRLNVLFGAVAKANSILGRDVGQHENLIQGLMRENRYASPGNAF